MRKLFILFAVVCLALLFIGEAVGQSVGGIYYARLGAPLHIYGTTGAKIFDIRYDNSYFTINTNTSSYPIRFFPEGTTSYVLEIQDDQIVVPSGKTLTVGGTLAVTGTLTQSGTTTYTGLLTASAGIYIDDSLRVSDGDFIGLGTGKGRMVWDDDTNDEVGFMSVRVGIGTLAPAHALNVVGNIALGDTTTGDVDVILYFATNGSLTDEKFEWDDGNSQFELSDDLATEGHIYSSGAGATTNNTYGDTIEVTGALEATTAVIGWITASDTIKCDSIYTLATAAWADYVFEADYNIPKFAEEINFIKTNKHLRSLQPASKKPKMITDGARQRRLEGAIEEIEKLYLFIEKQNSRIVELEKRIN